tara:strand:+ start:217 stop:861 length:645 start_codon:yes stop_codon:yes gene_type:complete
MNLNDKIKRQNLLVEELNSDVDNLLNEGLIGGALTLLKLLIRGKKYIPKAATIMAIKAGADMLTDKEGELEDKEKEGVIAGISEVKAEIEELKSLINKLEEKKEEQLPFKKIVIEFKKKVELDVQKMKSPEFQRNLIGTMYFKVMEINEDEGYLLLKTNSFPDTMFIRLEYSSLDIYKEQKGDVNLIYSRYKNPLVKPVDGDKEDCFYRIVEIQ